MKEKELDGPYTMCGENGSYGIRFRGRVQVTGAHFFGGKSDVKRYIRRAVEDLNKAHAAMVAKGQTLAFVDILKPPFHGSVGVLPKGIWRVAITPHGYSNFTREEMVAIIQNGHADDVRYIPRGLVTQIQEATHADH